jgi:hypothetical protein
MAEMAPFERLDAVAVTLPFAGLSPNTLMVRSRRF